MAGALGYAHVAADDDDDHDSDFDDKDLVPTSGKSLGKLARATDYTQVSTELSDEDDTDASDNENTEQQPQAEAGASSNAEGNQTTMPPKESQRHRQSHKSFYIWIALMACIIIALGGLIILVVIMTHGDGGNPTLPPNVLPFNVSTMAPTPVNYTYPPIPVPTTTPNTIRPSFSPSSSPSRGPSTPTTPEPSVTGAPIPTISPSIIQSPTMGPDHRSPIPLEFMIYLTGNTIDYGLFSLTFPPFAFNDSKIRISIGDCADEEKALYGESTLAHGALSLLENSNVTSNDYQFSVELDPLPTPDISYLFTMPIPSSLISECPVDYGYEIFASSEQIETEEITFPSMTLIESVYDSKNETLTATMYPSIWVNRTARFILSCTPGKEEGRRRLQESEDSDDSLDDDVVSTLTDCPAAEITPPIDTSRDPLFNEFSREYSAIGYYVDDQPIYAAASGTVLRATSNEWWGNWVVLKHDDGHASVYMFIAEWTVEEGDSVTVGDIIAHSYNDSHFRFECIPDGTQSDTKARFDCERCIAASLAPTTSRSPSPVPTASPISTEPTHSGTTLVASSEPTLSPSLDRQRIFETTSNPTEMPSSTTITQTPSRSTSSDSNDTPMPSGTWWSHDSGSGDDDDHRDPTPRPSRNHKDDSSEDHHFTPRPTKASSWWNRDSSDSDEMQPTPPRWKKPDTHSPTSRPSRYSSSSDGYWRTSRPTKTPSSSRGSRYSLDGSIDDSVQIEDPRDTYNWHGKRNKKKKKKKKNKGKSDSGSGNGKKKKKKKNKKSKSSD